MEVVLCASLGYCSRVLEAVLHETQEGRQKQEGRCLPSSHSASSVTLLRALCALRKSAPVHPQDKDEC